jgi:hypothetical protein
MKSFGSTTMKIIINNPKFLCKVKKPTNIKRSRAQVSPQIIRKFFTHLAPNIQGVPATHFFNYDETNLRDDPGTVCRYFLRDPDP